MYFFIFRHFLSTQNYSTTASHSDHYVYISNNTASVFYLRVFIRATVPDSAATYVWKQSEDERTRRSGEEEKNPRIVINWNITAVDRVRAEPTDAKEMKINDPVLNKFEQKLVQFHFLNSFQRVAWNIGDEGGRSSRVV